MDIRTVIDDAQGGAAIDNLAAAFGVPRDKAEVAANELLSALSRRIERNTLSRGGIADVVSLLGDQNAGRALADPQHLASPGVTEAGNGVLNVLIGDKHISRGIAAKAAKQSGLNDAMVKQMLPAVASLLVGGLQRKAGPALSQKLSAIPGIGDLLPMPGRTPASPSSNGTGDWTQDAANDLPKPSGGSGGGMGGATSGSGKSGGVILPMPGDKIPRRTGYDDLSDVVRKGGPPAPGGGSLGGLIRSILGGLLGFGNRGFINSLIYLFLSRFAMNFIRRILSRVLGGR